LDTAVFEKRDSFMFKGSYLSAMSIENVTMFKIPLDPTSTLASGSASSGALAQGLGGGGLGPAGLVGGGGGPGGGSVVDQVDVSTPKLGNKNVEGKSPLQLAREESAAARERLRGSMGRPLPAVPDLPGDPVPVTNEDIMKTLTHMCGTMALKEDVTTAQLETVKLLRNEFHDELVPVHEALDSVARNQVIDSDRIGKLESRMEAFEKGSGGKGRPDKSDLGHSRIAFKGFKTESIDDRFATLESFMKRHFGENSYLCIDTRMKGERKNRTATDESFVQFCTPDARDRVLDVINTKKYGENVKSSMGNVLKINKSKTDWQRQRDFAMRKSEELIVTKLRGMNSGATAKYETSKDVRKITVSGRDAFVQRWDDPRGRFHGDFQDLQLP
jgi:hypothetical protein